MDKSFEPSAGWEPCEESVATEARNRLWAGAPLYFAGSTVVDARSADLPFYATHTLLELGLERPGKKERAFVLHGPEKTRWLDGSSAPIHETNDAESLALTDASFQDYVRFFFFFVRGDGEPFVLIESPEEVDLDESVAAAHDGEPSGDDAATRLATVRSLVTPLRTREVDAEGRWIVDCSVAYPAVGGFFQPVLAVAPNGEIDMQDDRPVETLDGLTVPEYPPLGLVAMYQGALPGSYEGPVPVGWPLGVSVPDQGSAPDGNGRATPPSVPEDELTVAPVDDGQEPLRDREITEAIVSVLLEDAIREKDDAGGNTDLLLRRFNSETGADKPIERLAQIVSTSLPVIIVESDIPFVEDFVTGLVDGPTRAVTGGQVTRASVIPGDELRCTVEYDNPSTRLHLVSFHVYRDVFDVERTAHELALRDAAVLIGCERRSDVPEPLRRIADLVLTFPPIDRHRFARIFERVFGVKPTPGWDAPGTDWTRYLVPADFHLPRRLRVNPSQAIDYLRARIEARLRDVTPDVGPRLGELHGLGEARQICEDLIADIRAAQAGRIPWSAVDRGLLLVGPPGTGKTTLARAVAKECGIRFVVASAAGWQSAGYLDAHLRAMRADFTEARRYAPSILFIDEIDGIGSREMLGGDRSATYQTDVINALLEQIQGIATVDPVFVIGATNYPENVDPALRRSGRLDQVVELPLPNIASLEQIFAYYLKPLRAGNEVARGVKVRALAELSLGATGADVEFFVRGAARRARRANRKIRQEDLLAEVTRRPRRPDSAPRLAPEGMRRTAVHEAGHAVARLTSSTQGNDLTFVTIVPRTDGSLGFVATVPAEGQQATRRTMLEELETVLAGRAAEEIVYGSDDIGAGAGGPSRRSDLAVATRMAELVVCQSGLGADNALHWTEQPTPAQQKQIGALLARAYDDVVARLEKHRALLDQVVEILVEKQELSGGELRHLLADEHGVVSTSSPD